MVQAAVPTRKCIACGRKGRTVTTCASKVAEAIRKLKTQISTKKHKPRKPQQGPV